MLPHLVGDDELGQGGRLPSIHDLFGDHLARPVKKPPPFVFLPPGSSRFSLKDLGSSLPAYSRPSSPADSQGSLLSSLASSRSTLSQSSGYYSSARGWPGHNSPRRPSDASAHLIMTPSTSSAQDQFITLPPIQQPYGYSHSRDYSLPMRQTTSSRRVSKSHGRARSSSEAIAIRDAPESQLISDSISKRRHTIGSSRGPLSLGSSYPEEPLPPLRVHSSLYESRPSVTSSNYSRGLPPSLDSSPVPSPAPSTSSTASGEEVPTERRKSPAKYQCQYCGRRFNRPSSLKIHHNTHTGEKPFACSFPGCGRHFSVMSNMRRHARIHGEACVQQPREGSAEELSDMPSPAYSSSSSIHNTPVIPRAAMSYSRSHPPSASPSPLLRPVSNFASSRSESRHRHPAAVRSHPYKEYSSDEEGSSSDL